ncbi:MAG: pyridoxamine 5'-phosphate oxidase [Pseudomonadota bacterium]|nr:pyridoxamine 5'-phosphate oxidase [Pseudomonadota bacterium]
MNNDGSLNPIKLFEIWFEEAEAKELDVPNAMSLSTANSSGRVSSRMVLLKAYDQRGFVFYTNTGSRKGRDIRENKSVALLFHWKSLKRQVRITGAAEQVDEEEADIYFASRSRGSQVGAWASKQSDHLQSRYSLEESIRELEKNFADKAIPRPPFWTGYRVVPREIEFWEEKDFRLHNRILYSLEGSVWSKSLLYP